MLRVPRHADTPAHRPQPRPSAARLRNAVSPPKTARGDFVVARISILHTSEVPSPAQNETPHGYTHHTAPRATPKPPRPAAARLCRRCRARVSVHVEQRHASGAQCDGHLVHRTP